VASSLSAKKRTRQNAKRRARNRWRKAQVKQVIKDYTDAVQAGQTAKAAEQLKTVYKRLDKIAAKGTIHKNAAARQKARLARKLKAVSAASA
jgi:small subunit ribosomal protein S20